MRLVNLMLLGILLGSSVAIAASPANAQTAPAQRTLPASALFPRADQIKFQHLMRDARATKLDQRPMPEIIQAIAQRLMTGSVYKEGLLNQSPHEQLVLSLTQFDCVLFVETVLAMARGIALRDYSIPTFSQQVQQQRYRNGVMDGYCSRLHYFSEWIKNNEQRQLLSDLTPALNGVPLNKTLNFMSTHRSAYPQLKQQTHYDCIVKVESNLKGMEVRYIPTSQIRQHYKSLQPGDIVAVAINIPGLDVTHTGFVYGGARGQLGLIHAPAEANRVIVSPDLQTYMNNLSKQGAIGILVARPIDPRQPKPTPPIR